MTTQPNSERSHISPNEEKPEETIKKAQFLFQSENYAAAFEEARCLLLDESSHAHALDLAALCLFKLTEINQPDQESCPENHVLSLVDLGNWLLANGDRSAGEQAYHRALSIEPDNATAHQCLGVFFWQLKNLEAAEKAYREAIRLRPHYPIAQNNLAVLLRSTNCLDEAEATILRALEIETSKAEMFSTLGTIFNDQGRLPEAIAAFRHALKLNPDYSIAKVNLAWPLLSLGDYKEGFALYESRYHPSLGQQAFAKQPPVTWPRWTGEALSGKSILVWQEQGFGDALQFCRYLPLLKAQGVARLGFACSPQLARLMDSLDGIDHIVQLDGKTAIEEHDYWCHVMSLPHLFGTTLTTIPATTPYLSPPSGLVDEWRSRLPAGRLRVGLVWAGDPRPHTPSCSSMDQRRSMPVTSLLPILRIPDITYVGLQKGETTQLQIEAFPLAIRPFDPMHEVRDFADTAAIVECLDLVITVDTSVAHLAGALNKPVWVLSRYDGCWRWLLDRDDSPWYPCARIFRQKRPGDWNEVLDRVKAALVDWVGARQ